MGNLLFIKTMRIICIFLIFFMLIPISTAYGLSTKIQGKLSLIFILLGIGVVTKYLIHSDQKVIDELHDKLGQPNRVVEYQKGFEHWQIEWYGGRRYEFRDGVLLKMQSKAGYPASSGEVVNGHSKGERGKW